MRVIVFTKYPWPGKVKTRLGMIIGHEHAAGLQTAFLRDQLETLSAIGAEITLCCDPATPLSDYRDLLGLGFSYTVQQGHDLGRRMSNALHDALCTRPAPVLLIGSDLPDLPPAIIHDADHLLKSASICLGPTPDGGFYLLGMSRPLPSRIFSGVDWSTPTVLSTTLANLAAHGLQASLLPSWPDVDTADDLAAYIRRNSGKRNHTMRYIATHDPLQTLSVEKRPEDSHDENATQ